MSLLSLLMTSLLIPSTSSEKKPPPRLVLDDNGYIVYCPCMGRFGNQADQFLGALAFAKGINRTLVLPPWIVYPQRRPFTSVQIPFDQWFLVEDVAKYHRVLTMKRFMFEFAPRIWPPGTRTGFCYTYRDGKSCPMKQGNPFGPFWDHFHIDFDASAEHRNLYWNTWDEEVARKWNEKFPPRKFPVLAFHGAPGTFPSLERNQHLQQYITFSNRIREKARNFIGREMNGKPFVAIHLRNGIDMTRVCDDVEKDKYKSLFSSAQCTGHEDAAEEDKQPLTTAMCNPSSKQILRKVRQHLSAKQSRTLFIATDNDPLIGMFSKKLSPKTKLVTSQYDENDFDGPIVDLAIMSEANSFIGNCVSSFSAFVRRQRESENRHVDFFANGKNYGKRLRDEL